MLQEESFEWEIKYGFFTPSALLSNLLEGAIT